MATSTDLQGGYLSDQLNLATDVTNGWGPVERDRENGEQVPGDGQPLRLSGVEFSKGLGVHASSSLTFPLGGACTTFRASVGLDDVVRPFGGTVAFQVFADGEKLFDSGVLTAKSPTRDVQVNLTGRQSLKLVVTDGGDHIGYDHADWADARVECTAPTPPPTPAPGPVNTVSYSQSLENFRNPERGDIISYQPGGANDGLPENNPPLTVSGVRDYIQRESVSLPSSLIRFVYILGEWKGAPLPQSFLDRISSDMDVVRQLGLKAIPYFAYSWPLDERQASDAPRDRVLAHIEQLRPVLAANTDVTAFMFAGFIGPWGEWHKSTNDLLGPNDEVNGNTRMIMDKLLDVVPKSRAVVVRYPGLKYQLFDKTPLTQQEAFTGSARSRVGFHNECYMADYHPEVRRIRLADRGYLQQEGLYVPQAEMMDTGCFDFAYAVWKEVPCPELIEEMAITRPDATNQFPVNRVQGDCLPEVKRRTGYRYRLLESRVPLSARAGAGLAVQLTMTNDGFGGIYNPRAIELILRPKGGGQPTRLVVNPPQDTRLFLPAPGTTRVLTLSTTLPAGLAPGQYDVLLALPDPMPSLHSRPEYAIRLANENVWEAGSGFNALGQTLDVQP
ncbi:NPCBM/NEW2 domain-containing protein [Deinococcus koreensis]|uniref:NPCBM/NEW2 domain-containing protein n=1 Tax=Deinococcus koreensis TaxID=2054903 RepID=UPI0013FDDD04|nr:NPCBM/NEW2 domain-containing protein [Deinococcus koreensis]